MTSIDMLAVAVGCIGIIYAIAVWVANVNIDRKNFKEFMVEIKNQMMNVHNQVTNVQNQMNVLVEKFDKVESRSLIESDSPLQLTELGQKISEEVGAEQWAENEFPALLEKAEGKDPFEIQTMSFNHVGNSDLSEEMLSKMRSSAFENGLELGGIRRVLGIVLRDYILKERGLLPSSLDRQNQA